MTVHRAVPKSVYALVLLRRQWLAGSAIPNVVILTTVNCTFINSNCNRGCAPTEEETIEAAFTLGPSLDDDAEDRFGVVGP